jgi:hypothetical protein
MHAPRPVRFLSTSIAGAVCLAFALACGGADLTGVSLTLDGDPWPVESCTNGAPKGFAGIELVGVDANRLRIVTHPTGSAEVIYFAPGSEKGNSMGQCGTASFEEGNIEVNGVKGLNGGGAFDCKKGKHSLQGAIQVKNCAVPLF